MTLKCFPRLTSSPPNLLRTPVFRPFTASVRTQNPDDLRFRSREGVDGDYTVPCETTGGVTGRGGTASSGSRGSKVVSVPCS